MFFKVISLRKLAPVWIGAVCLLLAGACFFFIAAPTAKALRMTEQASAEVQNGRKVIILDPGHGGMDSGAVGADGTEEKDLNLQIAKEIGEQLSVLGYAVLYTRTEDCALGAAQTVGQFIKMSDMKERVRLQSEYPDATFISVHMNSYGAENVSGLQVFYAPSDGSEKLAKDIQECVCTSVQPTNHRLPKKGEDIYVLKSSQAPAVLIECGFMTNPEEMEKLKQKDYQKELSFAIVCGIMKYDKKR